MSCARTPVAECVFDASAILAAIAGEPGADEVEAALGDACVSAVNLAEVASKLAREHHDIEEIRATLAALAFDVVDFDEEQALEVARLLPLTRAAGLSLGDRACLALASLRGVPAMTADRDWAALNLGVQIVLIR